MSICCPDIYLYLFYLFGESWHLETILKFPVKTLVLLISLLHDLGFLYFSWDPQVEVTIFRAIMTHTRQREYNLNLYHKSSAKQFSLIYIACLEKYE